MVRINSYREFKLGEINMEKVFVSQLFLSFIQFIENAEPPIIATNSEI